MNESKIRRTKEDPRQSTANAHMGQPDTLVPRNTNKKREFAGDVACSFGLLRKVESINICWWSLVVAVQNVETRF